ncbi:MATE family efflux transporter [Faecalibacterium sp. An121]|uniref:MATE family efflux transporter n=1 Tax=Faecalibacterium sp. An121 TaxID=1965550 RepID=UPI000B3700B9|nr:MATE family efflux transporter [Faecalibacterium sp. An121]OUQ40506.1 MATE family efflux transporter [Faecalibacterium sp. An121]
MEEHQSAAAKAAASVDQRLGTAPLVPLIFSLALPTALAQLVNMLYNIVDRIYVGHIPGTGSLALAGLGVTYPIIVLITAFSNLIGMGGAPRASVAMGRGDYKTAEKILGNCITLLVVLSVLLSVVFTIFGEPILMAFGASENTLPYAMSYLRIYLLGTLFVQFTLGMTPFITNQGFAKTSMATTCIGAISNIILDPVFIFGFNMGVQGAAIATILSQAISAVWVLAFFTGKRSVLRIRKANLAPDGKTLALVLSLGVSPFLMTATECVIQLAFNTGAATYGGDSAVAIMSILFSVAQIANLPVQGFCQGAQPVVGFNFGAQKLARVRQAFKIMLAVSMGVTTVVVGAVEIAPQLFLGLFSSDAELIALGTAPLRIYMLGYFFMGAQLACQQTFLGLGEAKISMFIALLRKVILLLPLSLVIPRVFGALGLSQLLGLYLAEPISDIVSASTCTILFFVIEWKKLKDSPRTAQ